MELAWLFVFVAGLAIVIAGFVSSNTAGIVALLAVGGFSICFAVVSNYVRGIRRHVVRHFGIKFEHVESLAHRVPRRDCVSLHRAIEALRSASSPPSRVFGMRNVDHDSHTCLGGDIYDGDFNDDVGFTLLNWVEANQTPQTLNYVRLPSGQHETVRVPTNALYLLRSKAGIPFVLQFQIGKLDSAIRELLELGGPLTPSLFGLPVVKSAKDQRPDRTVETN